MTLEKRLKQIEASNRRWRWGTCVVGVTVALIWSLGAKDVSVDKVISANAFEVLNNDGKTVGTLGADDTGACCLQMHSETEKPRVKIMARKGTVGIFLIDSNEKIRANLLLGNDGRARLDFGDANGETRCSIMETSDEKIGLVLRDTKGKIRANFSVAPDGEPLLGLIDTKGNVRASLLVAPDGEPLLALSDKNGKSSTMTAP